MAQVILTDLGLARRLERAEAAANAEFVAARAALAPESGAGWIEVAGAYAMFDGVGSPLTQTFGLGVFARPADADLAALERFFAERGADADHEVCPLAGADLYGRLCARGYRPIELSNAMVRALDAGSAPAANLPPVRVAGRDEAELWADTSAAGWAELGIGGIVRDLGLVHAARPEPLMFLAELAGRPAAAGALFLHEGVALLAGASTIPAARKRGCQAALLAHRLEFARDRGCDVAMMVAEPGSGSQRNAERNGFRIAYTRTKWRLTAPSTG